MPGSRSTGTAGTLGLHTRCGNAAAATCRREARALSLGVEILMAGAVGGKSIAYHTNIP